jgi:hypothetical protein
MAQQMRRPEFEAVVSFWTGLLGERGLPRVVQWIFHDDLARLPPTIRGLRFALRPASEFDYLVSTQALRRDFGYGAPL